MTINLANPAYRFDKADTIIRMGQNGWDLVATGNPEWCGFKGSHAGVEAHALVHFDDDGFVKAVDLLVESLDSIEESFTPEQLGRDLPSPADAITLVAARLEQGG